MPRIRIQYNTKQRVKIKTVHSVSQLSVFIKKCFQNKWKARALMWINNQGELYECGAVWEHEEMGITWYYDQNL